MNQEQKNKIREDLNKYLDKFESQNRAANSLKGVSSAVISQIKNGKTDLISDEMWRNIASQIGSTEKDWVIVETTDYKRVLFFLNDAQKNSNVYGIIGEAGTGKSQATKHYNSKSERVYLIQCNEYWNRKMFMSELLTAMGKDYSGLTVGEMMMQIVTTLKKEDKPLIIMDEADKLTDQVLYFFITLYNSLEDNCGIVMCATDHLEKRIKKGLRLNKKGYKEIYSRLGRKFIELKGASNKDITSICRSNGIDDSLRIQSIINESEGDLRRVKREVHKIKLESQL